VNVPRKNLSIVVLWYLLVVHTGNTTVEKQISSNCMERCLRIGFWQSALFFRD